MSTPILTCRNPACKRRFTLDADHRHTPYCCEMCQRNCTPRGVRFTPAATNTAQTLLAKPTVTRKHAKENRSQTE